MSMCTFVFKPIIVDLIEIVIVEWSVQQNGILVVQCTIAMEQLIFPITTIRWSIFSIIQSASSMNLILFEVSLIVSPISIPQRPIPVFLTIECHALVSAAIVVSLHHIHALLLACQQIVLRKIITGSLSPHLLH